MIKSKLIILVTMFPLAFIASAQIYGTSPDSIHRKVPNLNGHTFIPGAQSNNPFITTHLKIVVGTAQTESFNLATLQIGGKDIYTIEGRIYFSSINLEYQQRIKDWLAMYFRYTAAARFGTEFSSLYSEGLNTFSGTNLGWLIKLAEYKKHMISANFEISDYEANYMNLKRFILNIVEDTVISVSENIPALFGSIGLKYAYAPNDMFGFGLSGEVAYGESFNRAPAGFYFQVGLLADFNLYERTGIPVGLIIKNITSSLPSYNQISNEVVNLSGVKIAYTGGNDYVIGLDASWSKLPSRANNYLNTTLVSLQFHLYF